MEKYFESLASQSLHNFQIIIVDDSSTDDSYSKAKEFADKSGMNIILTKTPNNQGPGFARNIGINLAVGEWILFIDNDDWVSADLLEKMDNIICSDSEINCILFDYMMTDSAGDVTASKTMYKGNRGYISVEDAISYTRNHTFGKVYRLDCLKKDNILFPEIRRCEDVGFVARALASCKKIYYCNEPLYYYFQRNNSLSNNTNIDETPMIQAFRVLEESLGEGYSDSLMQKSITDLLYGVLLIMCKNKKDRESIIAYIDDYCTRYHGWEKCEIIKCIGKAKRLFLYCAKHHQVLLMKIYARAHTALIG